MERWRQYRQPDIIYRTTTKTDRPRRWRWRLARRFGRRTGIAVGLMGLVWLILWSPVFAIRDVVLAGETTASLENMSNQLLGRNLITLSEGHVYRDFLKAEPSLASLRLTRGFPHQLQIHFERRHPALIWIVGETRWAVDEEGIVFPYDSVTGDGRPPVIDRRAQPAAAGQKIVTADFVRFVQDAGQDIPTLIGGRLRYGEIDETTIHVRFVTEWGWAVILDSTRPLAGQLQNLELVIKDHREQIHEYVDLRLKGWAYLK
ncbi:MAG: hypothetical protein AAB647_03295 [Patescibacteria group bacterium]